MSVHKIMPVNDVFEYKCVSVYKHVCVCVKDEYEGMDVWMSILCR